MERADFLKELNRSARALKRAFPKDERGWLVAMCSGRSFDDRRKRVCTDAVYELMCCFSLIAALKPRVQNLRLISAPGPNGFRFPAKPGSKENFAFFRFEKDGQTYDLCCGTEIPAAPAEPAESPDISLQQKGRGTLPASDRTTGLPIALWDAKYHKGDPSKSDVQQMNYWCDIFDIPKCQPGDICSKIFPAHFRVSAVITNVRPVRFNRTQLLKRRFSVLPEFQGNGASYTLTPSRADHESAP